MDDAGVCFSPGALALLAAIGTVLQGAIVCLFWLLIRAKDTQIDDARAERNEWRRVAVRGADEIIPPLVQETRARHRARLRELQEP